MITAWILYALLVGSLAAGGALVLESLLRAHRRPVRWVWAGAMAFSVLWPLRHFLEGKGGGGEGAVPPPPDPGWVVALEPLALQVGPESLLRALDGPLLAAWVVSSGALLLLGLLVLVRTHRLRRRWTGEEKGGRAVLFSQDWGPAVVGVLRPRIVLPAWCRELEEDALRLILDHESEHLEAGDLPLLLAAAALLVLLPWNLPLWWQLSRLRLAVEGDCDLRVLRKDPGRTRSYLELLLEVGRRLPGRRAAAAMLSEPEETLERRIRIMTMPFPRKPWVRGVLLAGVGAVLVALACWAPNPLEVEGPSPHPSVVELPPPPEESPSLQEGPVFTPYTVRPDILNRDELISALQREYPPLLRDAGIGGQVLVWFFIDENGVVRNLQVNQSSGHRALDEAALKVASVIRFSPALNRDKRVPVWISVPITFTTGDSPAARPPRPAVPVVAPEEGGRILAAGGTPTREGLAESPVFTPYTVRPDILNRDELIRALRTEYPPILRDAGIGGTALVWFFIDENGVVRNLQVHQSSGHPALDDAALRVASVIRFSPALNRDERVPVWISLPITFTTR